MNFVNFSTSILLILLTNLQTIEAVCFPRDYWPVERRTLHYPNLEDLAQVLRQKLTNQFHYTKCEVILCPDLRQEPFYLASPGMTGSTRVLDIGGLRNIVPRVNRSKSYSLVDMMSVAELNSAFAFGAGAGPFKQLGYNSEGVYNFNVRNCKLDQHSVSIKVTNSTEQSTGYNLTYLNDTQGDVGLLGNLFASKGLPGKVIRLHLKQRLNDTFILGTALRTILHKHFGKNKPIALGLIGVFKVGVASISIMPDFATHPVNAFSDWVHYFNATAPFIMLGTIVTADQGLHLYTPHIHVRNDRNSQGGHFIGDITPDDVEYDLLLIPAEYIYRVDQI